ncbi:MAG TPA: hypothetical protein VIP09_02795 [Dehalococcoidia bacterium]
MAPELVGTSEDGIAVSGESQKGEGVRGVSLEAAGVVGKGIPAGRFDGNVDVDGTVNATHMSAQGNVSALGNVNGGNVNAGDTVNTTHVIAQGNISALGNVNADGNINALGDATVINMNVGRTHAGEEGPILTAPEGHIIAQGNISALGNVNGGNVNAGDTVNTTHVIAQGNISALGNVNAGNVNVTGDITLENADCAEEFDVDTTCAQHVGPGTVVVLGDEGCLRHSRSAYDKRVAGVVSGGGGYRPGIILDQIVSKSDRMAVALLGKVFCNVDATYGSVAVGDLLTTSDTPGHAMKASDSSRAFGAVIGKALGSLQSGRGSVPILVALQ